MFTLSSPHCLLKAAANATQVLPHVSKNNHFEITSKIQTGRLKMKNACVMWEKKREREQKTGKGGGKRE